MAFPISVRNWRKPDVAEGYHVPPAAGNAIVGLPNIHLDIRGATVDEIERIERRLKLHDVRVLMSVVQAGSMHKAAEHLGTSQPAVSRAIADLEHALGVRLLDRSPSGIEPTQYGHAIIKRGLAVFDELRQGVKDVEFLTDPTSGELRIGCSEQSAAGPVLAVIDRLTRRYPRIVFDVVTGPVPTVCRYLTERRVELVIQRAVVESVDQDNMVVENLFDDDIVIVAAKQNPWTRRRQIELAELAKEPWTLPPPDTGIGAFAMEAFRARGLKPPRTTVITYSMHMRNKLLATGRFLTMWSRHILLFPGKHPSLKALPVELHNARGMVAIITLKNRTLSPLAELFIKTIRAVAKPLAKAR